MYFPVAFVLAALPFLAEAAPFQAAPRAGISVPISRRGPGADWFHVNGTVDTAKLQRSVRRSVTKIQRGFERFERNTGVAHPSASKLKKIAKRDFVSDPLVDDDAQLWYGKISVGTPAKTYTVDFDTGSSDLFLPGANCGSTCSGHTVYNVKSSSTAKDLKKKFSLAYGDGSTVSGEQYSDTVSIAGLTATKQTLGAATTYSTGFESDQFPADGLLGMAFQSISDYNAPPLFQSLVSQGKVDEEVFAFYMAEQGSELTIGGTNPDLFTGDFTFVPVTQEGYWQTTFDGISVNGKEVVRSTDAIIDTGTTLLVGDSASVKAFYAKIPGAKAASQQLGDGLYEIPCTFNTPVSITFGGVDFEISPSTFNVGPADNTGKTCVGGLSADDDISDQFWIVGDVFLQNAYTVFDYGNSQIGFASLA